MGGEIIRNSRQYWLDPNKQRPIDTDFIHGNAHENALDGIKHYAYADSGEEIPVLHTIEPQHWKARKLQQGKIDAKRDERELREDIDIRRREEINELQTKVNKTIEEIAKDQSFDLIMYQGVAYASPKIDITDQIIKALGK